MQEQQTVFNKIKGLKDIVLNTRKHCEQVDEATCSIINSRETFEELLRKNAPVSEHGS